MSLKQLYINGIGTGDYGIYISSDSYLNAPAPDYEAYQVPGRSGDLLQWNKRLNNIARKFTCYIPDDAQANFDEFKRMLYTNTGYLEISSDYEPDTYQRGYLADEIEAEPFLKDDVLRITFDLIFSCEPQKYFKDNTTQTIDTTAGQSTYMGILPRSHKLVQKIFQAMPSEAVPSGDYFVYVQGNPYHFVIDEPLTFTSFNFSMPNYTGFVASFFAFWTSDVYLIQFTQLIGYSNFGDLNHADLNLTSSDANSDVAFLFPVDAVGQWGWTGQTANNTYTASGQLAPRGQFTEPKAIGVHYVITISGTYGYSTFDEYDKDNNIVIKGSLGAPNRRQTINAMISIDATPFRALLPNHTSSYPYTISIDTETLEVVAKFNNNTDIKMSNYVSITGELDGLADELTVYECHETLSSRSKRPLWITSISMQPKWWTI